MPTSRALLLPAVILLVMSSACTTTGGVSLRPDGSPGPQECSEKALEAMRYLKLHVGDAALVELDANQMRSRRITLYDGPVESVLMRDLGPLETTTRLYGQVWTSGPQVVVRYYKAHPPDGEEVPICAVARLSEDQLRKRPESKPGTAILDGSMASAVMVNAFR
ncbi:serine/threonine protein kinase [Pyxidicoccus parkwayensis]|uniref:Serine/threonine protein kinase n=1 Tax=Pyxidicoccus parkwayensis TaxID=2813578 RepID=A0ABX7NSI3_9BACT|nr:serine/threonine protein kinase [Pyxidicoccus parkwaysis]QSQ20356.1 serine/threonine protein kinase [Pyxidicoccus parkwaysis]